VSKKVEYRIAGTIDGTGEWKKLNPDPVKLFDSVSFGNERGGDKGEGVGGGGEWGGMLWEI